MSAGLPSEVATRGWVRSVRRQKHLAFIEVSDGSCQQNLQVVVNGAVDASLTTGSAVQVSGTLQPSLGAAQTAELHAQPQQVVVVGACDATAYPLQKKGHTLEFLRDLPHLRPRTNTIGATLRVRHVLAQSLRATLEGEGFLQVHTPVLTSNDCEGAGELFRVTTANAAPPASSSSTSSEFFGRPAFLTVSGQLHAEAIAAAIDRVYTFGPTFRAENSNTTRHLAEFWMLEPEMAFATLDDVIGLAERCVQGAVQAALARCGDEIRFFQTRGPTTGDLGLARVSGQPFQRLSYSEAVRALQSAYTRGQVSGSKPLPRNKTGGLEVTWGDDLSSEQERWICDWVGEGRPVFVTHYPAALKPFYMRQSDDPSSAGDEGVVEAFDLLAPRLGELVGGSAREERLDKLRAAMQRKGLLTDDSAGGGELDWYLDLRRFGSAPHGGWGLGFERLVLFVTGLDNIRDAIPMPRAPGLCRM